MTEIVIAFKDLIIPNLCFIGRLILIPFLTLGLVYTLGRLAPLLKTDNSKNNLALFAIILFSYMTGRPDIQTYLIVDQLWEVSIYTLLSVIIYVTVCWKLYDRMDSFLDNKLGEDKQPKKVATKKKMTKEKK